MKLLRLQSQKAGFKPHRMLQAQARGRAFNPNEIISVEVTLVADTRAELDTRAAFDLARNEAKRVLHGAYHVHPKNNVGQVAGMITGFTRTFTVEA